ncbi:MAG TPA: S41 family peptidase [Pyrinomonadaceae bacterium]|jgi:carboxyl-terminal processing protease
MKNKTALSILFLLLCFFTFNENLSAQKRKAAPRRSVATAQKIVTAKTPLNLSPDEQNRLNAFYFAWETIKNNYFDQTFSGLNWDNIKKEYEPRVLTARNDAQLHNLLQEMINRLNRSHFVIIPPEVYKAIEKVKAEVKAKEDRPVSEKDEAENEESDEDEDSFFETDENSKFGIGVDLRLINDQFVIARVEKNSAAEKAGLKTGYVLERINAVALSDLLKNVEIYYANGKNIKRQLPAQVTGWFLNGTEDSEVELSYSNEIGQSKSLKIKREKLLGETISIGKNFPEQYLKYESAALNEDVGYVKFNLFALPVIEKFCASLSELKDKKALIIDLRGNSGGVLGTMVGLSGMLTDKSIDLGTQIYRIGSENMIAFTKAKNYKGKVVLLVDNQTASAAEVFASALQENNRALVVGEKTAGEALPSVSVELPTGAFLLYPIANFKTHNGNYLEGKGVEPNFVVALDKKSLLAGTDNQLEKALSVIKDDKNFTNLSENKNRIELVANIPPPPRATKVKGKVLAQVTVKLPPPPAPKEAPVGKDEKSLQIINEFINKIGGEEALNKIGSYTLKGKAEISVRGSKTELNFSSFRQKPDKYAEVLQSETTGEIREIYNGKNYLLQADFGVDREAPTQADVSRIDILSAITDLLRKDSFVSLIYQGSFDRLGVKVHLIEGKMKEGASIGLAFDVESKLLVSYIGQFYALSLGDYRSVENVKLPFYIEREHIMKINLDEIKLNPSIENAIFNKKENCFDKAN